jgi:acyl-CoA dehydrogenase
LHAKECKMFMILQFILLAGLLLGLAYYKAPQGVFTAALGILLLSWQLIGDLGYIGWFVWPLYIAYAVFFHTPKLRRTYFIAPVLKYFQLALPPMSETEREALESGDKWLEADLINGKINWSSIIKTPYSTLNETEQAFLNNQVEHFCENLNDWEMSQNGDMSSSSWSYLKQNGFFGMIIPKEYGGLGFSAQAHSCVISRIATRSCGAAVSVMVPNSLGPGELLIHYGTEQQKSYYLPRLAKGEEIPCFALTGIHSGSDATNMSDIGVISRGQFEGKDILGVKLSWDKRYITLAPVATLLGLAVRLSDPNRLLGDSPDLGITLFLLPTQTPGVKIGRRHNPLNVPFMNGPTSGKEVFVPLDYIIGGPNYIGKGWRMLVECLSVGRGISLPALSTASGQLAYKTTGAYARVRQQFGLPIGNFEGVEEALAKIGGLTYQLEAVRMLTISGIDNHIKPAVITAIAKYHMTEMARKIINHAMDIHGGKGIMQGPGNYLAAAYQGAPISITVEGANILTRNLIIFGQGAFRSHDFVQKEIEIATNQTLTQSEKVKQFDKILSKHISQTARNKAGLIFNMITRGHFFGKYGETELKSYYRRVNWFAYALAFCTDISMLLLGGKLKRKERLSARLGDVLSHLYLCIAVLKYYANNKQEGNQQVQESLERRNIEKAHAIWALDNSLFEAQTALVDFYENFPYKWVGKILKVMTFGLSLPCKAPTDALEHKIAKNMLTISDFRDSITHLCFIGNQKNDPLFQLENALHKLIAAEPLIKKLKIANVDIIEALKQNLITDHEAVLLREAYTARDLVIQVDDFEYDRKERKNAKPQSTQHG